MKYPSECFSYELYRKVSKRIEVQGRPKSSTPQSAVKYLQLFTNQFFFFKTGILDATRFWKKEAYYYKNLLTLRGPAEIFDFKLSAMKEN